MAARVSPTETIRAEIHELFADGGELLSVIEQVARLSVRLTFQSVIEEIVCEELGRGRYQRRTAGSPEGYRNGWQQPGILKTSLGPVELQRPKLRHAHAALCERLFGQGVTRTNALETLVISCWVRGLSDRDVEAMLARSSVRMRASAAPPPAGSASACGPSLTPGAAATCRPPASTTCTWTGRSSRCTPRPGPSRCWWPGDRCRRQAGVLRPGPRGGRVDRCLAGAAGGPERPRAGRPAAGHLRRRQGAGAAIERSFAASLHQRCVVHICRNLIAKVPTHAQDQVKRDYWAVFDDIEAEGEAAVAEARRRAKRFIAKWQPLYPSAVACMADNLDALVAHLLFPAEHRKRIRHSNLIERTFGETRRRVKVIGRLPGEQSCLSLVWAVLDRSSKGWRGLTMTPRALRRLQDLRRELLGQPRPSAPEEVIAQTVTAAA